jgi:hypothetical protein
MALYTLVYVSVATNPMNEEELHSLLEECRTNNEKHNITGMLLYRDGYFIQALEGEEEIVTELYNNIAADPRHERCLTVYRNRITDRAFGEWAMGFNRLDKVDPNALPGFSDFLTQPFDVEFLTQNPSRARILLESFKEQTYF